MNTKRDTLRRIEAMLEPRHLFILPDWAAPAVLDQLLEQGYLTCLHVQRDEKGVIYLVMGLQLTQSGRRLIHPPLYSPPMILRALVCGTSMAIMSLIILYWG